MESFRGYPVTVRRLDLGGRTLDLLGPANYESLVDDPRVVRRFAEDEFLPYWAEFWPACLLLADAVAGWPVVAPAASRPLVLELGCGLGLAGLVAAQRGYRVIASDYEDDALAFVIETARRNGIPAPQTRFIDWRARYDDLRPQRIIAAEVLYETRSLRPIAEFIAQHLAPQGFALISDANRGTADTFDSIARACGLSVEVAPAQYAPGYAGRPVTGRLFRLTRRGASERETPASA